MIVTKYFVYIHTSRHAGTFLNKLILEHVPGAQMIQYHGHLKDLPEVFSHLPVIGFVRNPWDWYASMYFDYRRKKQYIFQILSEGDSLDFAPTVERFLNLGDGSELSRGLLSQLIDAAPVVINTQTPVRQANPGLRSDHFADFCEHHGYYSWLFQLMFESTRSHRIHIGRFENVRAEAMRLFELTGTPITKGITAYLEGAQVLNSTGRPKHSYIGGYPPDLEQLVAEKDRYLIDRFGYIFSSPDQWAAYPKTDYFSHMGSVDVEALISRVKNIAEDQWEKGDEEKPNKLNNLNETKHIMFRFINGFGKVFDYHDFPVWIEWKDILLPIMEHAAKKLGYKNYRFPRIMLAKIPAGGEISNHTDRMASHYIHKIHVPLITNPETIFHVGAQSKNLPAGEMFEVNNKRNHSVRNGGKLDRVHLIFECYNMDDYGKPS